MSKGKLRNSIQENGGFKHWFVNVFWFHYRWPLLVGIVILGIVVFITVDSLRQTRYDTTVVIATDYFVDEEELAALDEVLKPVVEDLDGNGQVNIYYAILFVGDTELGRQNQERMYLYMTQEDVALYLMSENISDAYTNPKLEYFTDPVEQYGLEPDPNNEVRTSLVDNQTLKDCGLENIYLSFMDHGGGSETRNAMENAVAMAQALVEAG